MLHEAAQGTGAKGGIVGAVDDVLLGGFGQNYGQLFFGQTAIKFGHQQIDDVGDVTLGQRLVEHGFVQTVQKLGTEGAAQQIVDRAAGIFSNVALGVNAVQQVLAAQIGRQDNNGVLEIHRAALTVGDTAVIQYLQQHIEHIGVCLFHFVEQNHRVGAAAHCFGQLTALFVAHIAGRGADQAGHGELFHILAHVDAHHIFFAVEQGLGQRLGQLGLAHAGGAKEQEGANGLVRVGDTGPGAQNGLGHQTDGLVLSHHAFVKDVLQMQQLFALTLHQLGYGNAGPALDDAGDLLLSDLVPQQTAGLAFVGDRFLGFQRLFQLGDSAVLQLGGLFQIVLALRLLQLRIGGLQFFAQLLHLANGVLFVVPLGFFGVEFLPHFGQFFLNFGQMLLRNGVGLLFQGGLFDLMLNDLAGDDVQLGGHGVHLGADHGAGLVHQVDGLVGQETVGDIAVGQGGGGNDGAVLNFYAVIDLVALFQTAQDGDGVLHRGLGHHDRLEAALQRGVLFDILAVLVEGGGTNAVQLTPGQHRFEQVAGVHGTLGFTCTHNGVQFVDEQNDAAFRLLDLIKHRFQPFLKLAAVFGSGHQTAHIQREDGFILQTDGDVALDDTLGQPFGDGGFAHAGLTDEHRVVLALAGQNTDDIADFVVTANDRVQLVGAGVFHQIGAVFFQRVVSLFRVVRGDPLVAAHMGQGLENALLGNPIG